MRTNYFRPLGASGTHHCTTQQHSNVSSQVFQRRRAEQQPFQHQDTDAALNRGASGWGRLRCSSECNVGGNHVSQLVSQLITYHILLGVHVGTAVQQYQI